MSERARGALNGETYFFREPEHLAYLEHTILPDLTARRAPEHVLRVWSAGCATGEEAYTLAIILDRLELLGRASILGTDLSTDHLARAREARYRPWSFRGVPETVIASHFDEVEGRLRPKPHILRAVRFAELDLFADSTADSAHDLFDLDLVVLRNVLIHLEPEGHPLIARRIFDSLAPGGYLIVGAADPSLAEFQPFEVELVAHGLIHRRPMAPKAAASPSPPLDEAPVAPTPTLEAIRALADEKRSEEAASLAVCALKTRPLDPELHVVCAEALLELGRRDQAADMLRRALYLDPQHALARTLLEHARRRSAR